MMKQPVLHRPGPRSQFHPLRYASNTKDFLKNLAVTLPEPKWGD